MRFSDRIGITDIKSIIQLDFIDEELQNGLWNIFQVFFIQAMMKEDAYAMSSSRFKGFIESLWFTFFKEPMDLIPYKRADAVRLIRERFFDWEWYKVYNFIEFTLSCDQVDSKKLSKAYNFILEREVSGYRFIDNVLAPITSETEINSIQEAIDSTENELETGVNTHLRRALEKLADKKNPDYRNSIKESISAVESISKIIAKDKKADLGKAIKAIKTKIEIHPALEKGFLSIYGYTSDGDGIRHALLEKDNVDFEDAQYMLVACSSFVNYLKIKADKAEI